MGLSNYWPLIRDAGTIAHTLVRVRTSAGRDEPASFAPGWVRAAVERIHPPQLTVRVADERWESRTAKTLALAPAAGRLPPFTPGQHIDVHLPRDGSPASCVAAITSQPTRRDVMEITVDKRRRDRVSASLLDDVHQGDHLVVSGPKGDGWFHPARDSDDLVFVTGSDGLIGFISTIEHVLEARPSVRVLVLYGARAPEDLLFRERLGRLSERHPRRLIAKIFLARPAPGWAGERGTLTAAAVRRFAVDDGLGRKTFFLGGPAGAMARIRDMLFSRGLRPARLRSARSHAPVDICHLPGWPDGISPRRVFTINASDRPTRALAGEPLLPALEQQKVVTRSSCLSEACGACRVRLTEGRVFTTSGAIVSPSGHRAVDIFPCVSYPLSDLTVASS